MSVSFNHPYAVGKDSWKGSKQAREVKVQGTDSTDVPIVPTAPTVLYGLLSVLCDLSLQSM